MAFDARSDYPLGSRRAELLTTPSGLPIGDVTLDALVDGRLNSNDLRATPDTLRRQADVARAAGRPQFAENLERAAELASVPTDVILEIYTALRPRRSTAEALERWAARLDEQYGAARTAAFVREARAVYERRGLLALTDEPAAVASP